MNVGRKVKAKLWRKRALGQSETGGYIIRIKWWDLPCSCVLMGHPEGSRAASWLQWNWAGRAERASVWCVWLQGVNGNLALGGSWHKYRVRLEIMLLYCEFWNAGDAVRVSVFQNLFCCRAEGQLIFTVQKGATALGTGLPAATFKSKRWMLTWSSWTVSVS